MKKAGIILLLILLSAVLCLGAAAEEEPAQAAETPEEAEWTVMLYMCGSDLESKHSYATGNLEEISKCERPYASSIQLAAAYGYEFPEDMFPEKEKVNVVIQTGGCKTWHAKQRLGLDISNRKLQRWSFELHDGDGDNGYRLVDEQPLASMADPETLRDFIRWSAAEYPAKKYALVLWDHGGGSKTGLFIDELFDNDIMYLYELGVGLRDGGVRFETVLFDACLMANLETAIIIKDFAKYMVASEEMVAGQGTAIGEWLQELYKAPTTDGKRLGRLICDTAQIKCANLEDTAAGDMLTWSVIDLSKMDHLGDCITRFYELVQSAYINFPQLMRIYAFQVINSEQYGEAGDSMYDLASLFYNAQLYQLLDVNARQDVLEAIEDAVIYNTRGGDHFGARGLSFCYAVTLSPEELDHYALNCPSPYYLALVDAVTPWKAPDWVYLYTDKLPEIDTLEAYKIAIDKAVCDDGIPGVNLSEGTINAALILYKWYREDEETGEILNMGTLLAEPGQTEDGKPMYQASTPWEWPAVEGVPCCFILRNYYPDGTSLCEIPIKVGTDTWKLRVGYSEKGFEIYGVWDGNEYVGQRFNRNMKTLPQMAGQDYKLLYPVADTEGVSFEMSEEQTFYRNMEIDTAELPEGTYYLEYIIMDMFQRTIPMERIKLYWDGEKLTTAEGTEWEGTTVLKWEGQKGL